MLKETPFYWLTCLSYINLAIIAIPRNNDNDKTGKNSYNNNRLKKMSKKILSEDSRERLGAVGSD